MEFEKELQRTKGASSRPLLDIHPLVEAADHLCRTSFGFDGLYSFQKDVLHHIFSGKDVLGVFPTGSGKTLCYALPALLRPGLVLVISPLIALIRDQIRRFNDLDIPCAFFDSLQSPAEKDETWSRILSGEVKILAISPERLARIDFREKLGSVPIQMVAVDEAHCISQWGSHFRPDYRYIGQYLQEFGSLQKLAVTATATARARGDIEHTLAMDSTETVISDITRTNLKLKVSKTSKVADQLQLMVQATLNATEAGPSQGIVYCPTRSACRDLYRALSNAGLRCEIYHAGLGAVQRDRAQAAFVEGAIDVMVATHAFGMGIDKADIRFVHHFGLPGSVESYVQEIGRAGRDGEAAICHMVYGARDHHIRRFMMEKTFPSIQILRRVFEKAVAVTECHHGASETGVAKEVASHIAEDLDAVHACIEILVREGLLARLTSGGFSSGPSAAILTVGNTSEMESFFASYPSRLREAEKRLASIRSFAQLKDGHAAYLDSYFRTPAFSD